MRRAVLMVVALILGLDLILPQIASACATCFGAADAPMTKGMNNAILMLMAVVGVVYVGIGKVALDFRKRSRRLAEKEHPKPQLRLIRGEKD
jgi:p-aminobenzoyl-glutamate transporter AbgT